MRTCTARVACARARRAWHVHVHGARGVCVHGVCVRVCMACACVYTHGGAPDGLIGGDADAARSRTPLHTLSLSLTFSLSHTHSLTHTPQVVTLTLLDIVFLVINELLWGLLWTVVSRLLGRRSYAQSSINAYYEPPAFLFADRYAYMLKVAAMVLVFAPAVPLPAPMHQCTYPGSMLQPYAPSLQPRVSRCRYSTGWAA